MTVLVVLAGGLGKRLGCHRPKPLVELAGQPMIIHILNKASQLNFKKILVVVPKQYRELYEESFEGHPVDIVTQAQQEGTGAALALALPYCEPTDEVLVWYADMPLVRLCDVTQVISRGHNQPLSLVTITPSDPSGMGRIIRQGSMVSQIVEEKDATTEQQTINEVFAGMMMAPKWLLEELLPMCHTSNNQSEVLLTDVVKLANERSHPVQPIPFPDSDYFLGINLPSQWSQAERILQRDRVLDLQAQGALIVDISRCEVRGQVRVGRGVKLDVGVILEGDVILGDGVTVGPYTRIKQSTIQDNVWVKDHCVVEYTTIHANSTIGPFAYCRVNNTIGEQAKVGAFVELKNTTIGAKSKAAHLSYLGDAHIADHVNIGAGVITCNFDGEKKQKTIVGTGAFIGAGVELIAPITIGQDAFIGAGSTVSKTVEPRCLVIARARQVAYTDWHDKRQTADVD
ncbi:MAG: UDP-N-acetylglucosamine diphosphorylase/glucosamine-1-phosphate N-acetyltransferase [Legionellales bacterium]|nr:UDP-N-acetylglucosamine diphosphorylase/glucosamine-1-phosphate N-acetyltransferase [Legionellales bacterium]|tara:strand:- start:3746 stop:5116 length:1371 start_codon:yes stop_codon:yes gene_type:complete